MNILTDSNGNAFVSNGGALISPSAELICTLKIWNGSTGDLNVYNEDEENPIDITVEADGYYEEENVNILSFLSDIFLYWDQQDIYGVRMSFYNNLQEFWIDINQF